MKIVTNYWVRKREGGGWIELMIFLNNFVLWEQIDNLGKNFSANVGFVHPIGLKVVENEIHPVTNELDTAYK